MGSRADLYVLEDRKMSCFFRDSNRSSLIIHTGAEWPYRLHCARSCCMLSTYTKTVRRFRTYIYIYKNKNCKKFPYMCVCVYET